MLDCDAIMRGEDERKARRGFRVTVSKFRRVFPWTEYLLRGSSPRADAVTGNESDR